MSIKAEHPLDRKDYLGRYEREMDVNLTRMYENALDWEHLPYLHSGSFYRLDILDAGPRGWRARVGLQPAFLKLKSEIELELVKEKSRWVVTNVAGFGRGAQVWTTAVPLGENRIKVVVDFFASFLPRFLRPLGLWYYKNLYRKLYDEDESMMLERQIQLDHRRRASEFDGKVKLGPLAEIRNKPPLPFRFQNQEFVLTGSGDSLRAHARVCPHMLGPLEADPDDKESLYCPWHGYRFRRADGQCTQGNERLKLPRPPEVIVDADGIVFAAEG